MRFLGLVAVRTGLRGKRLSSRLLTRDSEGQALVEFAVCLPILLLIVSGIFALGIALNNYLELTEAASVGARLIAVSRGQTTDACATAVTAIKGAAPLLSSASLTYAFVINGTSYGSSCSTGTYPGAALAQGVSATVTVSYPCNLTFYGFVGPSCTLRAQVTELIQ